MVQRQVNEIRIREYNYIAWLMDILIIIHCYYGIKYTYDYDVIIYNNYVINT